MPRPRKSEKPLPPELLDQLPRILNQTSFCDDELEKLAQDCEEEEGPINNDHLYSERYLSLRESAWAKWEQYCSMSGYDKEASWIDYAQNSYDGHTQKPYPKTIPILPEMVCQTITAPCSQARRTRVPTGEGNYHSQQSPADMEISHHLR